MYGDIYQLKWLMLALIKGSTEKITFQLSTEDVEGEKFDDVVLFDDKDCIRLQAKHTLESKTKKINYSDLVSTSYKNLVK